MTPDLGAAGGGDAAYENEYRRIGLAGGGTMDETNGRTDGQAALAGWPSEQAASGGDERDDEGDAADETAGLASLAWGPSGRASAEGD